MEETATIEESVPETEAEDPGPEPEEVPAAGVPRVLGKWLPPPSKRRLLDHDVDLLDEDEEADLIMVSTRAPAGVRSTVAEYAGDGIPVAVVCHPGGEEIAVDFISRGASAIVAEGAEHEALGILTGESRAHMVDSYLAKVDVMFAGSQGGATTDPITQLPAESAFELRLVEMTKDGTVPRIGLIELPLHPRERQLGTPTVSGIRRRFAANLKELADHARCELYDLGSDLMAFVSSKMTAEKTSEFVTAVLEISAMFAPAGDPLGVAVGTAGPESASDAAAVRSLAQRALEAARGMESRSIDAEELTEHSASSLEMEATIRVSDAVDRLDPRGKHQERVAAYTIDLARHMKLEPQRVAAIGLAARLHDIGKIAFGKAAFEEDHADHERAVADHPERGAEFVRLGAGQEVAAIVRSHHERWDGSGFPDAKTGTDIPYGARILAVADRYDHLTSSGMPADAVLQQLREESGTILDPELVDSALELFGLG